MELNVAYLQAEILDQYVNDPDPRPWIIGFSGGKDSTMLLQLVWYAIHKLPPGKGDNQRHKRDIYVVCNNTLVENPKVIDFTEGVLQRIEEAAVMQDMPVKVIRTQP